MTASPKHRSDGARPRADTTRRQYDRWAAVYDWVWRGYIRATTEALLAEAQLAPGERVLNVGCGTGGFEAPGQHARFRSEERRVGKECRL